METPDFFRREALEDQELRAHRDEIILIPPGWTRWTAQVLLGVAVFGIAFLFFGSVSDYAEGPAFVRATGRVTVSSHVAATVSDVAVVPGQRVSKGDLLVAFHASEELARHESLEREFNAALIRMLAHPTDSDARQALAGLKTQRELVGARLAALELRAPEDGTVSDIRVRVGQSVSPGDRVLSMNGGRSQFSIVALLPGQRLPSLNNRQPLRVELAGYAYAYQTVDISHVGDEVISASEARRLLGNDVADGIPLAGPVVVVVAELKGSSFVSGGRAYPYHDGMLGTARARLGTERLIVKLFPSLRALRGGDR